MNTIRIIIAEDDTKIAEIQRRFIERIAGFEVVGVAHTTIDAKDMIEILEPNLVLLDIHFPDGNGLDLLRDIRNNQKSTDVILITAAKDVNSLTEGLHNGVFDYILKPLVFDRLQSSLVSYQEHLNKLFSIDQQNQHEIDQTLVDLLLPRNQQGKTATSSTRLPKGIDSLTLAKIRRVYTDADRGYTAEQIGDLVGSSRTTARRYLEYLVSELELVADVSYGSVGRPERLYLKGLDPDE